MFKKKSFEQAVNEVFEKLFPYFGEKTVLFGQLKHEALNSKSSQWVTRLDAALLGFWAEGKLSDDELAAARVILAPHFADLPLVDFVLLLVLGSAITLGTTLLWFRVAPDSWMYLGLACIITVVACLTIGSRLAVVKPQVSKKVVYTQPVVAAVGSVLVALLLGGVAVVGFQSALRLSVKSFNSSREELTNGDFNIVRSLAKDGYGVDVILGEASDSWAQTSLSLRDYSPASMAHEAWYCEMNIRSDYALASFPPPTKELTDAWLLGLMMHELGHCLDADRDKPTSGKMPVDAHSIAPAFAKDVHDVDSFLAAESQTATKLWREALADSFAIGYWKLQFPADVETLSIHLLQIRTSHREDQSHRTACWIQDAVNASVPASDQAIFEWADHLREISKCSLEIVGEP